MRIVIAIPCLLRGGTEMQTLNLVQALVNTGHKVTTLCYFETDASVVTEYEQAGSQVFDLNLSRTIKPITLIVTLRKTFAKLKPHAIHVQYMAPGALPIIAARLAGIKKIIATVHQPYTPSHGRLAKSLLRFSALLCSRFIVVSKNSEQSWFGSSQLYDENKPLNQQPNHFTIYNAVDVDKIQQIKSNTNIATLLPTLPANMFIIGAVSRLRIEKGIDILIEAFAIAIQTQPNMHLLLVGSGPDAEQLKQLATNKAIAHHCTFYGEANWKVAMQQMARMDVVVVPSRFEGFGLTAAEAMAMGKPVIASKVYGLAEVVDHEQTGLLFEKGDTAQLAIHMQTLCNNEHLRKGLGKNAYQKTLDNFSLTSYYQKTQNLYEQMSSC